MEFKAVFKDFLKTTYSGWSGPGSLLTRNSHLGRFTFTSMVLSSGGVVESASLVAEADNPARDKSVELCIGTF